MSPRERCGSSRASAVESRMSMSSPVEARRVAIGLDPARATHEMPRARGRDQRLVFRQRILDQRQRRACGALMPFERARGVVARQPGRGRGQRARMVIGVGFPVHPVAHEVAQLAREGVGIDRGALDDSGIAETRRSTRLRAVDEQHGFALGLDLQRASEADDSRAEYDHVRIHGRAPLHCNIRGPRLGSARRSVIP